MLVQENIGWGTETLPASLVFFNIIAQRKRWYGKYEISRVGEGWKGIGKGICNPMKEEPGRGREKEEGMD